jgi:hypothetical protein
MLIEELESIASAALNRLGGSANPANAAATTAAMKALEA